MLILLLSLGLTPAPALPRDPAPAPGIAELGSGVLKMGPASPGKPVCQNARFQTTRPAPARMGHLSQMPPANAYYAVLRLKNGCDMPVMTRENVEKRR